MPACLPARAVASVRAAMLDQVPGFAVAQAADDLAYKTVTLPPLRAEAGSYFTAYDEGSNAFLVCARDASLPGPDGEPLLRVVYVLDAGGFDELHTAADYEAALRASFPAPLTSVRRGAACQGQASLLIKCCVCVRGRG